MKRLLCLLTLMMVLFTTVTAFAMSAPMYVDTPNHKSVNLRATQSTKGQILCSVPYGKPVSIINMLLGSDWVHCRYEGHEGYILRRYLSSERPAPTPKPAPTPRPTHKPTAKPTHEPSGDETLFRGFAPVYRYATVVPSSPGGFVNMRWAPSKQQPVFDICYAGTELMVLYANNTWCQVYNPENMTIGYMMRSFLELGDDIYGGALGQTNK